MRCVVEEPKKKKRGGNVDLFEGPLKGAKTGIKRWFGLFKCFRVYFVASMNFAVSLVRTWRNLPALVPASAFLGI